MIAAVRRNLAGASRGTRLSVAADAARTQRLALLTELGFIEPSAAQKNRPGNGTRCDQQGRDESTPRRPMEATDGLHWATDGISIRRCRIPGHP